MHFKNNVCIYVIHTRPFFTFWQVESVESDFEYAMGENGEQVEDEDDDNTYAPSDEDEDLESELDAHIWLQDVDHPLIKRCV